MLKWTVRVCGLLAICFNLIACGGGSGSDNSDPVTTFTNSDPVTTFTSSPEFATIIQNANGEVILDESNDSFRILVANDALSLYSDQAQAEIVGTLIDDEGDLFFNGVQIGSVTLEGSNNGGFIAVLAWFDLSDLSWKKIDVQTQNGIFQFVETDTMVTFGPITFDSLVSGETISGEITALNPFKVYQFIPDQSGTFSLSLFEFGESDLDLYILDENFFSLASSDLAGSDDETIVIQMSAGEIYYIRVYGYDLDSIFQTYSLSVQAE